MEEHPKFIPIFLETVLVDTVLDFDLYLFNKATRKFMLYRGAHMAFHEAHRKRLLENKIANVFIRGDNIADYQVYLETHLDNVINNPVLPAATKATIIYQSARNLMGQVFDSPDSDGSVKRSKRFVQQTVNYVLHEKDHFSNLLKLTSHDYYTYTHSVNVCVYTLALGRRLGMKEDLLQEMGTGALLHDIGKSRTPREILMKPGKLDPQEWAIMQKHSEEGMDIVSQRDGMTDIMKDVILHHHEKLDGSGYPDKLKAHEISEHVRISCICDIFDALTTNRPYKKAVKTAQALEIINAEFYGKIDRNIFREFILLFHR